MTITLQTVYADLRNKKGDHEVATVLLRQTDWFSFVAEFDPKSGEALTQSLSHVLAKVARYTSPATGGPFRDRLWRIAEHSRPSVVRLFQTLNESPRREQALLPIHALRELDASSFIKLSNRPGRNIREKLAGKPYLQASRRFQSINLPENRLLKEFATRLTELLELRLDCLGEKDDDLLSRAQSWLRSDEVRAIARWENLPPNNTLLAHRDYRRVWDAWRWLQTLDHDIARDLSQLEARTKTMRLWTEYARAWADGDTLFAEMPILFNYENFVVRPWVPALAFRKSPRKLSRTSTVKTNLEPVCVDLSVLRPSYATETKSEQALCETYFWQHWENRAEPVDIELFNSDAACIHPDATSISVEDLFFSEEKTTEYFERAARVFASRLRSIFKSDTLIWLVPDSLSDFDLEVTRRNLNARFPDAKPLPRSVAAAFMQVDYSKINNDGFPIAVVDSVGGKTCVTTLLARFDPTLNARLPETRGFYWERCPPVVISSVARESTEGKGYDLVTVDEQGKWRDAFQPRRSKFVDPSWLKGDSRIGEFAFCINLTESPVVGGIRLHSLQQRAGDIPLWRDQISELSIKVIRDGRYQRFHLVSRGTTVRPIRGMAVSIPVDEAFTLPAGRPFYQFPLFQGENADELGFSARLDSPAFPLKEHALCKLNLAFEYGADEPYILIFTPIDKSFAPVRATWRRSREVIITDAPSPDYPTPMSWANLQNWIDAQGKQIDLLGWLIESLSRLHELIPNRCSITISSSWKQKADTNNMAYWFAFANTGNGQQCYCNTKHFVDRFGGDPNDSFPPGTEVFCNIRTTKVGIAAFDISTEQHVPYTHQTIQRIIQFRERSLQNRMALIWGDARSLENGTCPPQFRNEFRALINSKLLPSLPDEVIDNKIQFLLACMHKDAPDVCVRWIIEQVKSGVICDLRAVGFALGDVSEQWQEDAFATLVKKPTNISLRVFSYAIWRERHFIEKFNFEELHSILNCLVTMLSEVRQCPARTGEKDKKTVRNWVRATVEPLELLFGLLRTRVSSNSNIRMLLQPHQEITKELANQVERIAELVAQSNVKLYSRVQINIQKPEDDRRTPDLLYALRLYLTGDDGANAIHITSISDSDDD